MVASPQQLLVKRDSIIRLHAVWRCVFIFCLVLVPVSVYGQAKEKGKAKDKDNVVGTIWEYKAVNGSKVEKGTFRVSDKEIFKGAKKVGVVKPKDADETKLTIDGMAEINGTMALRKTKSKPPIWKGVLSKEDGSKWDVTVEVKDR